MPPVRTAGQLATRGDRPALDHCPLDRALQVVGHRTSLLLMREVFYGATRFDLLVKRTGMTEAVASQRLRALVEGGLLTKSPYREQGQRTRHEYLLTPSGHDLLPVLLSLLEWGEAHTVRPSRGDITVTHADCGEPVAVVARCAAGHDVPESEVVVAGWRD